MDKLTSWLRRPPRPSADRADRGDLRLVRGSLAGRRDDFAALVEKHQRPLQRFVEHHVGDRHAADEIAQAAFVQAYAKLESFRGESTFKTWVYTVALNLCRDRARAEQRRATTSLEDALETIGDDGPSLEETVLGATVQKRVASLPERQRAVVTMRIWGDLSFAEIAVALGTSENSAKVSYHHAIRKLKAWLTDRRIA